MLTSCWLKWKMNEMMWKKLSGLLHRYCLGDLLAGDGLKEVLGTFTNSSIKKSTLVELKWLIDDIGFELYRFQKIFKH